jgi:hypothetical protein
MLRGIAVLVVALALGCQTYQQNKKENLLETAGFRMVAANTPERINALNTLPAGKISKVDREGTTYFVFPDAKECRCLRVGRQEQYDRYVRLTTERNLGRLETTGADTQSEAFKGYEPW